MDWRMYPYFTRFEHDQFRAWVAYDSFVNLPYAAFECNKPDIKAYTVWYEMNLNQGRASRACHGRRRSSVHDPAG